MCKQDDTVVLTVWIPPSISRTGKGRWKPVDVDRCIAPIVRALNDVGVVTVASCCGHDRRPGNIALIDGREIVIAPDYESGRRIDALFSPTS